MSPATSLLLPPPHRLSPAWSNKANDAPSPLWLLHEYLGHVEEHLEYTCGDRAIIPTFIIVHLFPEMDSRPEISTATIGFDEAKLVREVIVRAAAMPWRDHGHPAGGRQEGEGEQATLYRLGRPAAIYTGCLTPCPACPSRPITPLQQPPPPPSPSRPP